MGGRSFNVHDAGDIKSGKVIVMDENDFKKLTDHEEYFVKMVSKMSRIVWLRDLEPLDMSSSRMSVVTKFSWRR